VTFNPFLTTQKGTYVVTAQLSWNGRVLSTLSWSLVVVDNPKGAVSKGYVVGSNQAITDNMQIKSGPIALSAIWINNSVNNTFRGHLVMSVVMPVGSTVMPAPTSSDRTLAPL